MYKAKKFDDGKTKVIPGLHYKVELPAGNDDFYFVFVDYILQCLMIFSRDETNARISKLALERVASKHDTIVVTY